MHPKIEYLFGLRRFGIKPGLESITAVLDKLGNPHRRLRVIHVAGTNGKGSTSAMIASVLKHAGFKVGLYTSPHLVDYRERMQIGGEMISEYDIVRFIEKIEALGIPLTFFEFTTAIALLYFAHNDVDFVVLEVGLGGSWDATNVCDAEIAVFTSIGLDHTRILGDSIDLIAKDKCGIIKPSSKVVVGEDNNALDLIREISQGHDFYVAPKFSGRISLAGEFQKDNAGIAAKVCGLLGVEDKFIKVGVANTHWPGRLQFIDKNILFDCAHNPDAVGVVKDYVKSLDFDRLIVVFGVLADKDYRRMIKLLPKPDFLILTTPDSDRALDPVELAHDGECAVVESPEEALRFAKEIALENDLIFVTGSIFLVGDLMKRVL